ncbi:hypothetical protein ACQ4LE_005728 [Meloidogyne hapla]
MATTNSITSSTSTTTLSPYDITTNNSTTSSYLLQLNNQLIPPVSTQRFEENVLQNCILRNPSLLFSNNNFNSTGQQQQFFNTSETLPGLLASLLQNRDQQSSTSSLPLFCEALNATSLLSQQQLLGLIRQQQPSSSQISQFQSTTDFSSNQQNTLNGIQAFESLTLANYQKLAANKNVVIKPQLPPQTSQINGIGSFNIPPIINNFSTNKQQNSPSLEQQLLVLLNLQQQQPQHSQNGCESNSNNYNVATVINNGFGTGENSIQNSLQNLAQNSTNIQQTQQSTQQNSLESFHFKDDKIQERKNCSIRRSSSSVSYYKTCSNSNADVSEHFKRTFSGKWPKRLPSTSLRFGGRCGGGGINTIISKSSNKEGISIKEGFEENQDKKDFLMESKEEKEEKFLSIKMEKMPSSAFKNEEILQKVQSGMKCHLGQKIGYTVIRRLNLTSEDKQVEEHFRKSLGDDRFKQIRNNQRHNQEDSNAMDDDIDV